MQKGYKHSKETKIRMSLAALKRDNTNRLKSLPKREKHWNWSNTPNLLTLHKRLYRKYGKASQFVCVDCKKKANDYSNENGNYTDDIKDYKPRCRSCHLKKDKIKNDSTICNQCKGNRVIIYVDKKGIRHRKCKDCINIIQRNYRIKHGHKKSYTPITGQSRTST